MIYLEYLQSPIGLIEMAEENKKLVSLKFVKNKQKSAKSEFLQMCKIQLIDYFGQKRTQFEIPIFLQGTEFQMKVWEELQKIEYSKVKTYKTIAEKIGNSQAYRAVGNSVGKNPIPIIVPCHRVITNDCKIGGYSGGLKIKEFLLQLEGIYIKKRIE